MPCDFHLLRQQVLPLVADPDPNTTPPAAASLLHMGREAPNAQEEANALGFYFEANNGAAGTVTWTLWIKDAATGKFASWASGVATAQRVGVKVQTPLAADLFVQVTAVAGFVGAVVLDTRATEISQ